MLPNWTDPIIHWNQLGSTATKRLIDTWGKDPAFIAKYDKKHGHETAVVTVPAKKAVVTPQVPALKGMTPLGFKEPKVPAKKAPAKPAVRQKHTGADGEIKFLDHRNLYIGFFGGRVVVTKRTEAQCREFLAKEFGLE
jgi:hypothetical protein